MEEYFNQQDEFLAEMISTYENNLLSKEYEPYFAWKKGLFGRTLCVLHIHTEVAYTNTRGKD